MEKRYFRLVLSGHIDHGKSTLLGRLLFETNSLPKQKISEIKTASRALGRDMDFAFLTDQLKEERENQMTLDTAQAFFRSRARNYAIIDAPGHVELIKNMITGASQAQAAILVIALPEGMQEQTLRHASLIGLLGIKQLIVILNKMDLADYKKQPFKEARGKILDFLAGLNIKPAAVIPVCARNGANLSRKSSLMRWYKGPCLLRALNSLRLKKPGNKKPLRFPVQDIYEINGERIVAGKVASGVLRCGQRILLLPALLEARISAIKIFGESPKKAEAGKNIGIILNKPLPVKRGDILADKAFGIRLSDRFTGEVFWWSQEPLRINERIALRCASQQVHCVIEKIEKRIDSSSLKIIEKDAAGLGINEIGIVVIKTETPIAVEKFDFIEDLGRFILERNFNPEGAGIIT
ncbi:MAG: GTP-binding protein [Candidatus Omnitrophota bacterium]|jgi:sulfate adenylyltransferase subunit 1 (EFTu-like GTPase family)